MVTVSVPSTGKEQAAEMGIMELEKQGHRNQLGEEKTKASSVFPTIKE